MKSTLALACLILASLVCGLKAEGPQDKIVGGVPIAEPIPWYGVMVTRSYAQFCGGNLIAPQWFITAAHCVVDRGVIARTSSFWIWLAVQDLQDPNSGIVANPVEIYVPQLYLDLTIQDVALIKLDRPVQLAAYATLAEQTFPPSTPVLVAGFGLTSEQGSPSPVLQATDLVLATDEECAVNSGNVFTEICAGYPTGGRDSCQGDSGGPLFINNTLIGIVSRGVGCGRSPPIYGVYSLAGAWRNWVNEIMGGNRSNTTTSSVTPTTPTSITIPTSISTNSTSGSCAGLCGKRTLNCSCEERCIETGLCCSDYTQQCTHTGLIYGCSKGCVNGFCSCSFQNITMPPHRRGIIRSSISSVASLRSTETQIGAERQGSNMLDSRRSPLARPAWLASIRVSDITHCTSALIHPQWVLTTASCLTFRNLKYPAAVLSVSFPAATSVSTTLLVAQVENVFVPSTYLESNFGDIGLVKLQSPVPVTPVSFLDATGTPAFNNISVVTGFNLTYVSLLQLPLRNTSECASEQFNFDPNSEFCAGYRGIDRPAACLVDQGSPVLDPSLSTLVGICSRGFGCNEVDVYSVYTNPTQWKGWIQRVMNATLLAPKPGSCQSVCGGMSLYPNDTLCACDPSCRTSGDCCPDYKDLCSNETSDFEVPQTALDSCQCICNQDYKGMDCSVYMPVASVSSTGSPVIPTDTLPPQPTSPAPGPAPAPAPTPSIILPTERPTVVNSSNRALMFSPLFIFFLILLVAN